MSSAIISLWNHYTVTVKLYIKNVIKYYYLLCADELELSSPELWDFWTASLLYCGIDALLQYCIKSYIYYVYINISVILSWGIRTQFLKTNLKIEIRCSYSTKNVNSIFLRKDESTRPLFHIVFIVYSYRKCKKQAGFELGSSQ